MDVLERLHLRSDGVTETPSGLRAIVMFYRMRDDGVRALFNFKAHAMGETITIQWPSDSDVAILPPETSAAVVANNYARYLWSDEVDQYNALVDVALSGQETPAVLILAAGGGPLVESQVESPDGTTTPVSNDGASEGTPPALASVEPAGEVPPVAPSPAVPAPETSWVTPPAPPAPVPVPPPVAVPPVEPAGKGKTK